MLLELAEQVGCLHRNLIIFQNFSNNNKISQGLSAAKNALDFKCKVTVFEQQNEIGGTWIYTEKVGKDEFDLDIHSSMYQGLLTNLPKEIMAYPNFPFPPYEDSYITAERVLDYYRSYACEYDLMKYIRFRHHVLRVRPLHDDKWEVIVKDLIYDQINVLTFDAILICNGHYFAPNIPTLKGCDFFKGQQLHVHDYRTPNSFKDEEVLIIGSGPSGKDLATEVLKFARNVTWSHHKQEKLLIDDGGKVEQKPDVKEITADGVVLFMDGSSQYFSTIIYCTGYKFSFPFLSVDCGLACEDNFLQPLYKHSLNINRPSMGFIGLVDYAILNQVFDLQSRFCLTFMTGRKKLPSKEAMMADTNADMDQRWARGLTKRTAHRLGPDYHAGYYTELAEAADIEGIKPVFVAMLAKCLCNLLKKFDGFRNVAFEVIDDENFIMK